MSIANPMWLLVIAGIALPLFWILNLWLGERKAIGAGLAIAGATAHTIIGCGLAVESSELAPWYAGIMLCAILASAIAARRRDHRLLHTFRDEDEARCHRLLARDPNNAAAHGALGDVYLATGRYKDAIASFERAVALDPESTRGDAAHMKTARMKLAEEEQRKARGGKRG